MGELIGLLVVIIGFAFLSRIGWIHQYGGRHLDRLAAKVDRRYPERVADVLDL